MNSTNSAAGDAAERAGFTWQQDEYGDAASPAPTPSAQVPEAEQKIQNLQQFVREIVKEYCWGYIPPEPDGCDIQDKAEKYGLIEIHEVTQDNYDCGHVNSGEFDLGDTYYMFVDWMKSDSPSIIEQVRSAADAAAAARADVEAKYSVMETSFMAEVETLKAERADAFGYARDMEATLKQREAEWKQERERLQNSARDVLDRDKKGRATMSDLRTTLAVIAALQPL